jgi:TetR/AcrR family transcriptional regulator
MVKERDGDKTQTLILESAKAIFSQFGFKGTSLQMIQDRSGISKGLILHHFRSKENLYRAVKKEMVEEYAGSLNKNRVRTGLNADIVEKTIQSALDHFGENEAFHRMQLWDFLEGNEEMTGFLLQFTEGFISVVKQVQAKGFMNKEIPEFLSPIIIRGAIEYWQRNQQLVSRIAEKRDISMAEIREKFVRALVRCLK